MSDAAAADPSREAPTAPYPGAWQAWSLIALLLIANVVSSVDRGVLNMVVDPVRRELQITDVQISLVQGFAFGLFYATAGVPLGMLIDRSKRMRLLVIAIVGWSLATIMGGLAQNFAGLFASRMLIGLGEATLAPCALSLIADMFPAQRRGAPLAIYLAGTSTATGVSTFLVGQILSAAPKGTFDFIPGTSGLSPWRMAFILFGLVGIVIGLMFLTQREPLRRGGAGHRPDVKASFRYLVENRLFFIPFYVSYLVHSIAGFSYFMWNASLLIRHFHMTPGMIGKTMGPLAITFGLTGTLISTVALDAIARRWGIVGKLWYMAMLAVATLPCAFAGYAPNAAVAMPMLCTIVLASPMSTVAGYSVLSEVMPNNMRALSAALLGVVSSLLGGTIGPYLVAAATEHLFHDRNRIGDALAVVLAPAMILNGIMCLIVVLALKKLAARNGSLANIMATTDL